MPPAHQPTSSRTAHRLACALPAGLLLAAASASSADAQSTPPSSSPAGVPIERTTADSSLDSLSVRLQRAEEAIALLRQQLATQAASATQTASRSRFELSGRVLVNGFTNSRRTNNVDVPQFVRPDTASPAGAVRQGGLGASIRQTSLTGAAFVPRVLGAEFRGDVTVDFFGGQPQPSPGAAPNPGGRHFPIVRLRTARGMLRWDGLEVMAGQDLPLVAGVEPVSVAAVGVSEFGTAGNLWLWLPQLRVTLERALTASPSAGAFRIGVQGAVLAPNSGDVIGSAGALETDFDGAERTRRPYLQGRLRARWGEEENEGQIGIGVHRGWLGGLVGPLAESRAVVANAVLPFGWLELRGEAFTGQALRGLGGGGIAQNFVLTPVTPPGGAGTPLESRGGWGQVNVRWAQVLTLGGGCGVDEPDPPASVTLAPAFRLRNQVCASHLIVRPEGPLVLGLTYRRLSTKFARGTFDNDHVNLALGYQF